MTNKERRVRVLEVGQDGKWMALAWTQENGERVSGRFDRHAWMKMPRAAVEEAMKVQANPPLAIVHPYGKSR